MKFISKIILVSIFTLSINQNSNAAPYKITKDCSDEKECILNCVLNTRSGSENSKFTFLKFKKPIEITIFDSGARIFEGTGRAVLGANKDEDEKSLFVSPMSNCILERNL